MAQKSIFELDLVRIAKWHRRSSLFAFVVILSWILLTLLSVNSINLPPSVAVGILIFFWFLVPVSMVLVIALQRSLGSSVLICILYGILTVFFSLLVLLASASNAGTVLRLAGAKPGFTGLPRDQWDKLRPGHCRGCGYSRESLEILQECPECRRVPQVI